MLELRNVKFQYKLRNAKHKVKKRDFLIALDDLSLKFDLGVFYTVYGPSGSGKTTCLSLLGGLDVPTSGDVLIDEMPLKEIGFNDVRKTMVSYVFQDYQLFSHMTALENVLTAMKISNPKIERKYARCKATNILLSLGLDGRDISRSVTKLSGGQKQRVAIARALAVDSSYILADEPTGNLDSENTEIIITLLRDLVEKYNKCVIVVTHDKTVQNSSDVSYIIREGRLADTNIINTGKFGGHEHH
jgi:putative ABC transport system ATP-binding protein